jgi:hypothetical protein
VHECIPLTKKSAPKDALCGKFYTAEPEQPAAFVIMANVVKILTFCCVVNDLCILIYTSSLHFPIILVPRCDELLVVDVTIVTVFSGNCYYI